MATNYVQPNYLQILIYLEASLIKEVRKTANGRWLVRYTKNGGNCCTFVSEKVFTRLSNALLQEAVEDLLGMVRTDREIPGVLGWRKWEGKHCVGYLQLINGMLFFGHRNTRLISQSLEYVAARLNAANQ